MPVLRMHPCKMQVCLSGRSVGRFLCKNGSVYAAKRLGYKVLVAAFHLLLKLSRHAVVSMLRPVLPFPEARMQQRRAKGRSLLATATGWAGSGLRLVSLLALSACHMARWTNANMRGAMFVILFCLIRYCIACKKSAVSRQP